MVSDDELMALKALTPNRVRNAADCGCSAEIMSSLERRGFVTAFKTLNSPTRYSLTADGRDVAQGGGETVD
jgi:hypothetical protein